MKCEIIRDLLPNYLDGLTSQASNEAIEEHLETCAGVQEMPGLHAGRACSVRGEDKGPEKGTAPFSKGPQSCVEGSRSHGTGLCPFVGRLYLLF